MQFSAPARLLHYHRGVFHRYTGGVYQCSEAADADLRAVIYDFLEKANERRGDDVRVFKPNKSRVDLVVDALRGIAHLSASLEPPCWLDGRPKPSPSDLIPMRNGLFHVPTRKLLPHDPEYFALNALEFPYEPRPAAPRAWEKFLNDLWPEDAEAKSTLQEFFGYAITPDTRHQKILMIVGPKRSGKGTIARVLTALVGHANVTGPTLAALGRNFGLEPLIGKPLAIIADARLGGQAEISSITERLLSISGEDTLTLDRKLRTAWTGRLPTRFVILSNELPRFTDASGALPSRMLTLMLKQSFYGREDLGLHDRLLGELPGIFSWAVDGLDRLRGRGRFLPPRSSEDAVRALEDLASPVAAFVRDCCVLAVDRRVKVETLYKAWQQWCTTQGRGHVTTSATFGRDLRAACPDVEKVHAKVKEERVYVYAGIDLKQPDRDE
jgi:putative DNA primase/helicase